MKYTIKPIVCDYAVICVDTSKVMCICSIRRNAELIADILNGDAGNSCAYSMTYIHMRNTKLSQQEAGIRNDRRTLF